MAGLDPAISGRRGSSASSGQSFSGLRFAPPENDGAAISQYSRVR